MHDGEEVVSAQALVHALGVRCDRGGVAVVDEERLHGRVIQLRERVAKLVHVDEARSPPERTRLHEFRHLETLLIEGKRCAGGEQKSTAALLPASGDEWKHRDGASGCSAILAALNAVVEPDGRGSAAIAAGTAVGECERFDGVDAESR